mmetsp:Transcript_12797/g.27105  ORF Transcript_12797/g.27105 Transcript_12797/m.27105 type:complete len:329 (-) Transcript_12797:2028-3014(-)
MPRNRLAPFSSHTPLRPLLLIGIADRIRRTNPLSGTDLHPLIRDFQHGHPRSLVVPTGLESSERRRDRTVGTNRLVGTGKISLLRIGAELGGIRVGLAIPSLLSIVPYGLVSFRRLFVKGLDFLGGVSVGCSRGGCGVGWRCHLRWHSSRRRGGRRRIGSVTTNARSERSLLRISHTAHDVSRKSLALRSGETPLRSFLAELRHIQIAKPHATLPDIMTDADPCIGSIPHGSPRPFWFVLVTPQGLRSRPEGADGLVGTGQVSVVLGGAEFHGGEVGLPLPSFPSTVPLGEVGFRHGLVDHLLLLFGRERDGDVAVRVGGRSIQIGSR